MHRERDIWWGEAPAPPTDLTKACRCDLALLLCGVEKLPSRGSFA
jgi:hypothetical protein